jgi:hypothetical protein
MTILGKILLKQYSARQHSIVGPILATFVALFSSHGRLYLKNGSEDGDRILTSDLQYINPTINPAIIALLSIESNWNKNIYDGTEITVGEDITDDVFVGQKAIIQIPSGGRYYIVEAIETNLIIRSNTSYQNVYSYTLPANASNGIILANTHKLIPSNEYHLQVYKYEVGQTIKTEISYLIDTSGNITWASNPELPTGSKIIIRL